MWLSILASMTLAANPPMSPLATVPCEFGETYQVSAAHCTVEYTNTSDQPIEVVAVPGRDGDSIKPTTATIAPKATSYFELTSNTQFDLGRAEHWFYVRASGTQDAPRRYTKATGFVVSVLDDPKAIVDFGVLDAGLRTTKSLSLASQDVADFKIKSVMKSPSSFDVRIAADGIAINVIPKQYIQWGPVDEYVMLETNTLKQPLVAIRIKADVHGEIVPSENPVDLGVMRVGDNNETSIRLTSKSGKEFKSGAVVLENLPAKAEVLPCISEQAGCKLLRVRMLDEQKTGTFAGKVIVELPEFGQQLPVVVSGTFLSRDVKVKNLDEKMAQSGKASTAPKAVDVASALKKVASANTNPEPEGRGPLLKWSVANEDLIYGYLVYRSDSEPGPFLRVNSDTIRVKDRDASEGSYQWRDVTAEAGKTYWYYIGLLYNDGHKQKLSSPQKVTAK